jgi:hypothetical protein
LANQPFDLRGALSLENETTTFLLIAFAPVAFSQQEYSQVLTAAAYLILNGGAGSVTLGTASVGTIAKTGIATQNATGELMSLKLQ